MPIPHVIFDIETVLDTDVFARAHGLPANDHDAIKQAIGDNFPKAPYHRIVAIAATTLTYDLAKREWGVLEMATLSADAAGERELVAEFAQLIDWTMPTLVGYNSINFDAPVVRARAMMHRLKASKLARYNIRGFVDGGRHIDLCDIFSPRGRDRMSLDEAARAFGVGAKTEGMDGSQVDDLARRGAFTEIADYCLDDVVATAGLFLLNETVEGRLTAAGLDVGLESLREARDRTLVTRPATFVQAGAGVPQPAASQPAKKSIDRGQLLDW